MPALPLTAEQKEDAARLKQLFLRWKEERKSCGEPATQDFFSDLVGFGQSAVSQYLNGKIPLNPHAAAKFSKALGCQISDFSQSVASIASEIGEGVAGGSEDQDQSGRIDITELSTQEAHIVLVLRALPEAGRDELALFANKLLRDMLGAKRQADPAPANRTRAKAAHKHVAKTAEKMVY